MMHSVSAVSFLCENNLRIFIFLLNKALYLNEQNKVTPLFSTFVNISSINGPNTLIPHFIYTTLHADLIRKGQFMANRQVLIMLDEKEQAQ